eukprot:GDKJ01049428.1.p1 GENE.GDKJ01049428.1~~GDKJ01049428.1.p1  ORF type:complete len:614 (+),score=182.33 GDKJ01049428.1:9-1850(+)
MQTFNAKKEQIAHSTQGYRRIREDIGFPFSSDIGVMLTDWYQISMTYGYWKAGKHLKKAVFDLYFRKCPFKGAFTVLAGTSDAVRFLNSFTFTDADIEFIKSQLPNAETGFFDYLRSLNCSEVKLYGIPDGTIVFPNYPCLRLEGPLAVVQLLETPLLNIMNFASLIATNTARMRLAIGLNAPCKILEFGTRRAQGPDGAMSASRYSYLGGADGTANVRAGQIHDIPVVGTHAHAFITAFKSMEELSSNNPAECKLKNGTGDDLIREVFEVKSKWSKSLSQQNVGELAAFTSYALSYPDGCLCLIDTYDSLKSGVRNFVCVAAALWKMGHKARGIRLDSGDLAYLSKACRQIFVEAEKELGLWEGFAKDMNIVASNDINEAVLISLNEEGHEINTFGIGTNLVTCQAQPALGMVFKLAELDGVPTMKLSQEISKTSTPARKDVYRLYNSNNEPILDLIQAADLETYEYTRMSPLRGAATPTSNPCLVGTPPPTTSLVAHGVRTPNPPPAIGGRLFCRSLTDEHKRCYVTPSRVVKLLRLLWDGGRDIEEDVNTLQPPRTLKEGREYVLQQLNNLRGDHLRSLNPTPYKVAATGEFFDFFHEMWQKTAPIADLS